jgi:hypothetical protein
VVNKNGLTIFCVAVRLIEFVSFPVGNKIHKQEKSRALFSLGTDSDWVAPTGVQIGGHFAPLGVSYAFVWTASISRSDFATFPQKSQQLIVGTIKPP